MKKILCAILVMCMMLAVAACVTETPAPSNPVNPPAAEAGKDQPAPAPAPGPADETPDQPVPDAPAEPFPGKIAIVTNTVDQSEEEYRSAETLQAKYGSDKIVHRTWPVNFSTEGEQMITVLQQLAADPEIKAVIINQAVINTNAAVDKLLEQRDDVFIAYSQPAENPDDVCERANLIMNVDDIAMGYTMVAQAIKMGAETFAHYSFPRHMSVATLSLRRDIIKDECEKAGIRFADLTAPDPTSEVGIPGAQQFILEDVPKQVADLGKNTAFFSTNCAMQYPLIKKVVDEGAIFPQPCCPSPFHGFPAALGIADQVGSGEFDENGEEIMRLRDLNEVRDETRAVLAQKGLSGRLSTWPAPGSMMFTSACTEYAIKVINGELPANGVKYDVLSQLCSIYVKDITGEDIDVALTPLEIDGVTYQNFVMALMDYYTY